MTEELVELEEEIAERVAVVFEADRVEEATTSAEMVVLYRDAVAETTSVERVVRVLLWCATGVEGRGTGIGMRGDTTTSVVDGEGAASLEVNATQLGE